MVDGFSSEDEFREIDSTTAVPFNSKPLVRRDQCRLVLSPAVNIATKMYPIQPDTITG